MKKSLTLTFTCAIALATLGFAYADDTVDKGDLGKYTREGRFLKPVLTATPQADASSGMAPARIGTHATINKGELGTYVRHGRTLRAVRDIEPARRNTESVATASSGVAHDHGVNHKEHKNTRK